MVHNRVSPSLNVIKQRQSYAKQNVIIGGGGGSKHAKNNVKANDDDNHTKIAYPRDDDVCRQVDDDSETFQQNKTNKLALPQSLPSPQASSLPPTSSALWPPSSTAAAGTTAHSLNSSTTSVNSSYTPQVANIEEADETEENIAVDVINNNNDEYDTTAHNDTVSASASAATVAIATDVDNIDSNVEDEHNITRERKVKFDLATVFFQVNYHNLNPTENSGVRQSYFQQNSKIHPHPHTLWHTYSNSSHNLATQHRHSGSSMHHSKVAHHRFMSPPPPKQLQPPPPSSSVSTPNTTSHVPLWETHLPAQTNHTSPTVHYLHQLTWTDWLKFVVAFVVCIQLAIQMWTICVLNSKHYFHSSVEHAIPSDIEFPAITICLPVIIPFHTSVEEPCTTAEHSNTANAEAAAAVTKEDKIDEDNEIEEEEVDNEIDKKESTKHKNKNKIKNEISSSKSCKSMSSDTSTTSSSTYLPIITLFNHTASEYGHQCRIRIRRTSSSAGDTLTNGGATTNVKPNTRSTSCGTISPPIETYFHNKRCFTYLAEVTVFRSLFAESKDNVGTILDHQEVYITLRIQSNRVPLPGEVTAAKAGEASDSVASSSSLTDSAKNKVPELYIHSPDLIPIDSIESPIQLELNRQYRMEYWYLKIRKVEQQWNFFHCHNYSTKRHKNVKNGGSKGTTKSMRKSSRITTTMPENTISRQDCLDRCILEQQHLRRAEAQCTEEAQHCVSHQLPIRRDLVHLTQDRVCLTLDTTDCPMLTNHDANRGDDDSGEDQLIEQVLDYCDRHCPDDCTANEVQHDTVHDAPVDLDANPDAINTIIVTIARKIRPDLGVNQFPLFDSTQLIATIGGLASFWLLILWLCWQLITLLQYVWQYVQVHYL